MYLKHFMYLLCSLTNTLLLLRFTLAPSLLSQRVGIGSGYSIKKNESIKCMSLRGQNDKYIGWSAMLGCVEDGLVVLVLQSDRSLTLSQLHLLPG
jgi:hypothetical protein